MRAGTVVIIFCLVLSLVPCFADSASAKQQTKRKLSYGQVAVYGVVAAGVNAVISTMIATYYADLVRQTNSNAVHHRIATRDVLELVDAKINQELASRGLGQVPLDEVD